MIQIEQPEILISRSRACYNVMHEAALHSEKFSSIPEGLLVLMLSTAFCAKQYAISPRKLQASIRDCYRMIEGAQKFTGDKAGVAEVVAEIGLQ